jgi:hypothetical protein
LLSDRLFALSIQLGAMQAAAPGLLRVLLLSTKELPLATEDTADDLGGSLAFCRVCLRGTERVLFASVFAGCCMRNMRKVCEW